MQRLYYLTHHIDHAEQACAQLSQLGVVESNLHVLSRDEEGLKKHHLNAATPIHELDILRYGERGFVIGAVLSAIVITLVNIYTGWFQMFGALGVLSMAFLIVGFMTWIGGFVGVQSENYKIRRFHNEIVAGAYLLMVDVYPRQRTQVEASMRQQANVTKAGEDSTLVMPFDSEPLA